jgi:hypothetical protein
MGANMALKGEIVEVGSLKEEEITAMFSLMDEFYDHMSASVFIKDLREKDYCILLHDETRTIKGFSTQKLMRLKIDDEIIQDEFRGGIIQDELTHDEIIHGVFSGDTIIHRDYWGSLELHKVFAEFFIQLGKQYEVFYWFLISKGYKTYKMLPVFFNDFYPNYKIKTPEFEQSIMHTFGREKSPGEYDEKTGVIHYRGVKDKLKEGVADITERQLKDKNVEFFVKANPGYIEGNDLVCLTRLSEGNLRRTPQRLLLGGGINCFRG